MKDFAVSFDGSAIIVCVESVPRIRLCLKSMRDFEREFGMSLRATAQVLLRDALRGHDVDVPTVIREAFLAIDEFDAALA